SSGRQRVQQAMLENLVVNLPPLAEQKQIAGILGALDDKIELNRCINDNLAS
ncbi:restriction endonuclease subunit S, partial [Alistipes onderdonkii]